MRFFRPSEQQTYVAYQGSAPHLDLSYDVQRERICESLCRLLIESILMHRLLPVRLAVQLDIHDVTVNVIAYR